MTTHGPLPAPVPRRRRTGTPSLTHAGLLRSCLEYLQVHGAWTIKVLGGLGQRRGCPDILAGMAPRWLLHETGTARLIAIEVKTGKGRLTPAQKRERAALEGVGALFIEARSVDDLERALLEAGLIDTPALWPRTAEP